MNISLGNKTEIGNEKIDGFVCPVCDNNDFELLHRTKGGFAAFNSVRSSFYLCNGCGMTIRYPQPNPNELLDTFYALEYWTSGEITCDQLYGGGKKQRSQLTSIIDAIDQDLSNKCIVDIGCGFGSMLATLADELPTAQIVGIEPNIGLTQMLQSCNKRSNLEIFQGSLEKLPQNIKPDVIFLMTVFEHIIDPVEGLGEISNWISDDGVIVINLPDVMQPGKLGLDYFFRDFHLYYYSDRTLAALLGKCGFQVLKVFHGGVFGTATAPTLCVVAKKGVDKQSWGSVQGESDRIRRRIESVRKQTKYSGPLTYAWRYKIRRPFFDKAGRIKQKLTKRS